ncbi:MAG: hypothetical protein ACKVOL_06040 [Novosphingobium sp.]
MISLRVIAGKAALFISLLTLSGCGKPDVYAVSLTEAYKRLDSAEIEPSGNGVFYTLDTSVSGNSADEVTWAAGGAMAAHSCTMRLKKVDDTHTHVTVDCKGESPSSGAAAGMEHTMIRGRVIEMVDATLTGRKFDPSLANGVTAARWPGDGVDGSYAGAVSAAITMDADMRKEQRDAEAIAREREAQLIAERPDVAQGQSAEGTSPDP